MRCCTQNWQPPGENTGNSLSITSSHGFLIPNDKTNFIKSEGGSQDILVKSFFCGIDKNLLDIEDTEDRPIFDKAVALLGELKPGEIYGFSPALIMGGEPDIEHLERVNAVAHLHILAALGEKMILEDSVK